MSFQRERAIPTKMVDEIVVGELDCPKCGKTLKLIHREKTVGKKVLKHQIEESPLSEISAADRYP